MRSAAVFRGMPVVLNSALTISEPRKLNLWERFRCFVERKADEAELLYHFPRVERVRVKPDPHVYQIQGLGFVMHPATWGALKREVPHA